MGSGAVEGIADAARFPDRFRRIDLNQGVPPGFAALEIRCYDFDNGLRPDLAQKSVDVRATGVGGRTLLRSATFRAATPDVATATVRFPQAVRLDRAFQWRTVEVARDGVATVGRWATRADWIPVLDVTSPPEARPPRPPDPEDVP